MNLELRSSLARTLLLSYIVLFQVNDQTVDTALWLPFLAHSTSKSSVNSANCSQNTNSLVQVNTLPDLDLDLDYWDDLSTPPFPPSHHSSAHQTIILGECRLISCGAHITKG